MRNYIAGLILVSAVAFLNVTHAENYSLIDGTRSIATDNKNYDVFIISVDGKMYNKSKMKLSSGTYYFNIASTKAKKFSKRNSVSYGSYSITLKPCVRYLLSAQYPSSSYKIDDWELIIKEESIGGCEIKHEEQPFDPLNDPRTNNFQAEVYAISFSNFLHSKKKQCQSPSLAEDIDLWLEQNKAILDGANYQIMHLISLKNLVSSDETILELFSAISSMTHEQTTKLQSELDPNNSCVLSLKNLKDKALYNRVYSSYGENLVLNENLQKSWEEVLALLKRQNKGK